MSDLGGEGQKSELAKIEEECPIDWTNKFYSKKINQIVGKQ